MIKKGFSKVRDKAIIFGLYLSKFDAEALNVLGFKGFNEAFNTLGYSIGVKPASIKNYRDEFDPFFPNPRKGWHKRQIRDYCKEVYDIFNLLSFNDFSELIKSLLFENYEIEKIIEKVEKKDKSESVAKRLITGIAAEEYFKINYSKIDNFVGYDIKDTTKLACGFDFKLTHPSDFYAVEVKGLNSSSGNISLTEKEFFIANELKSKYCLFVVMNFIEKPFHRLFFNPLESQLNFKRIERQVIQVNYSSIL